MTWIAIPADEAALDWVYCPECRGLWMRRHMRGAVCWWCDRRRSEDAEQRMIEEIKAAIENGGVD